MDDIINVNTAVVDWCLKTSKHTVIVGDDQDEISKYASLFEDSGLSFEVLEDPDQIPLFCSIVLLDVSDPDNLLFHHNFTYTQGTIMDVHDRYYTEYFQNREHVEYLSCVDGEWKYLSVSASSPKLEHEFFCERLIRIFPELVDCTDQFQVVYAGATLEHRLDYMIFEQAIDKIQGILDSGIKKIIFWNGDENLQKKSLLGCQKICEYLSHKLPPNTFYYFTSGLGSSKVYQELSRENGFQYQMHIITGASFELVTRSNFEHNRDQDLYELFEPYKIGPREKTFLCFNRMPRHHRLLLLAHMLENNLVDQGYYSFDITGYDITSTEFVNNQIEKHRHLFPMVLNRTPERENPVELTPDDIKYYKNSYFSIVCETEFYKNTGENMPNLLSTYDCIFLSEKIFKPFATKHPFIVLGHPGSLQVLRHLGYRTFSPYINEDYDLIQDDHKRFDFIFDEIQRLCALTANEWLEWQAGISSAVEHNFQWVRKEKNLGYENQALKYFDTGKHHE